MPWFFAGLRGEPWARNEGRVGGGNRDNDAWDPGNNRRGMPAGGGRWPSEGRSASFGVRRPWPGGPPQLAGDFDAGEEFEPPKKRAAPDLR